MKLSLNLNINLAAIRKTTTMKYLLFKNILTKFENMFDFFFKIFVFILYMNKSNHNNVLYVS